MKYTETSSALARAASVTQPTVRKYADAGLLDLIVASDGTRLFRVGQAELVREIYRKRMAGRGRRRVPSEDEPACDAPGAT
jgi:DNA-binding transcriptional MerR regulator